VTELEALLRILVAVALGAALGLERELTAKPAGLRTYMLVAEGAALFMIGSILLTEQFGPAGGGIAPDPTRIPAGIVTGVGFLGAGVIFQSRDRILGITTAASIWVAAVIGMLAGAGYYITAVGGTVVALITLAALRFLERQIGAKQPPSTRDTNGMEDD
jgi:putative Mg2+ transporter-C (MgtC) family protein